MTGMEELLSAAKVFTTDARKKSLNFCLSVPGGLDEGIQALQKYGVGNNFCKSEITS